MRFGKLISVFLVTLFSLNSQAEQFVTNVSKDLRLVAQTQQNSGNVTQVTLNDVACSKVNYNQFSCEGSAGQNFKVKYYQSEGSTFNSSTHEFEYTNYFNVEFSLNQTLTSWPAGSRSLDSYDKH
jgi:hypothetical protein